MIDKRLLKMAPESVRWILANVLFQWMSLLADIGIMKLLSSVICTLYETGTFQSRNLLFAFALVVIRCFCIYTAEQMSYLSSCSIRRKLRVKIFEKLLRIGASYRQEVSTAEIVQAASEGVDQLQTCFGAYFPQLFYSMLASFTLAFFIGLTDIITAIVLLICIPLIPIAIVAVQKWAKKLLSKYWGQYTSLGDSFLENLQGLTTLKIYQADEMKNRQMNEEAEKFRVVTMAVLKMQLNSVTIMDFIACAGAALGMTIALMQFRAGHISLAGTLFILMLSGDFFVPLRRLGSYFHVAMNGMAASDRIFKLLELPEENEKEDIVPASWKIELKGVSFGYEEDRNVLQQVSLTIPYGSFTAVAGPSGCGKSTLAGLLTGRNHGYTGSIVCGDQELSALKESVLLRHITYVGSQAVLFKGTVRENLRFGKENATDEEMKEVLQQVQLKDFLDSENGLDTVLMEGASNFSGGQRQRLALARALLHDSEVYIFDEATSNIDAESEEIIMQRIRRMAGQKTVIVISHRLANVASADQIAVFDHGTIAECGSQESLLEKNGIYAKLWNTQQKLEQYTAEVNA